MIPVYFYPTTILFLDDNTDYLKHLSLHLPNNDFLCKFYNDPRNALDFINTNYRENNNLCWSLENSSHLDSRLLEIDIANLYTQSYNSKRFSSLSTIIVDYDMPYMNGIEFLNKIKFPEIQKILLTGEADSHLAIEAFNNGIINQFIPKQNLNLESQLNFIIRKSQLSYFNYLSLPTLNALACDRDYPSALAEKEFALFFQNILQLYDINEFFLLDPVGSFLMLTHSNELFILHTQNEDQVESYYLDIKDLSTDLFTDAEKDIIKQGKKIFCFKPFDDRRIPDSSCWKQYYYPAETIEGSSKFYCSITKIEKKDFCFFEKIKLFNSIPQSFSFVF